MASRGWGQTKSGRSKHAPFVRLDHGVIDHPAWRALSPYAVQALVCLARGYKGPMGFRVMASVRHVMQATGQSINRAGKSLAELQEAGFIVALDVGHMGAEGRGVGTTYRITFLPAEGHGETHDYRAIHAAKIQKPVSRRDTRGVSPDDTRGATEKAGGVSPEDTRNGQIRPEPVSREDTTLRIYHVGEAGDDAPDPAISPIHSDGTDPGTRKVKLVWRKPVIRELSQAEFEKLAGNRVLK